MGIYHRGAESIGEGRVCGERVNHIGGHNSDSQRDISTIAKRITTWEQTDREAAENMHIYDYMDTQQ